MNKFYNVSWHGMYHEISININFQFQNINDKLIFINRI
jgi:hypothetical protein